MNQLTEAHRGINHKLQSSKPPRVHCFKETRGGKSSNTRRACAWWSNGNASASPPKATRTTWNQIGGERKRIPTNLVPISPPRTHSTCVPRRGRNQTNGAGEHKKKKKKLKSCGEHGGREGRGRGSYRREKNLSLYIYFLISPLVWKWRGGVGEEERNREEAGEVVSRYLDLAAYLSPRRGRDAASAFAGCGPPGPLSAVAKLYDTTNLRRVFKKNNPMNLDVFFNNRPDS